MTIRIIEPDDDDRRILRMVAHNDAVITDAILYRALNGNGANPPIERTGRSALLRQPGGPAPPTIPGTYVRTGHDRNSTYAITLLLLASIALVLATLWLWTAGRAEHRATPTTDHSPRPPSAMAGGRLA